MKRIFCVLLVVFLCFGLIACAEKDKVTTTSGDEAIKEGEFTLSGETVLLPSVIKYIGANGVEYDMQTIEMDGSVAKIRFYFYFAMSGKTMLDSGYDVDLSKMNPFELTMVHRPNADGTQDFGFRRYTVSDDLTRITEEYAYDAADGVSRTTKYTITYDSEDRIEKIVITDKYGEEPETVEERFYSYGETGYTISYIDMNWSQTDDDDTRFRRYFRYDIPYEGDKITITETYCMEDGKEHYPDDFHTNSDKKVDRLVYEANRQGFCTANTLYFKDGSTETNQDFFGGSRFTAEFNDNGMPTSFFTTSLDGTNLRTSTYTYDENGNLSKYTEKSEDKEFTVQLQWEEYPAELAEIFGAVFNCSNFAIREVIEDNCPEILVGPQEFIYKKSQMMN